MMNGKERGETEEDGVMERDRQTGRYKQADLTIERRGG